MQIWKNNASACPWTSRPFKIQRLPKARDNDCRFTEDGGRRKSHVRLGVLKSGRRKFPDFDDPRKITVMDASPESCELAGRIGGQTTLPDQFCLAYRQVLFCIL
jgi:hypothetical protein